MKGKRILALLLAAVMMLSLAACGSSGGQSATTAAPAGGDATTAAPAGSEETTAVSNEGNNAKTGGSLIIGSMSDCTTFAPWGERGGGRMAVRRALYETLIHLNSDGSYDYDLAKSLTEVSDGVYDIEIYDYIKDTAGNPMTADDVVFSFDKAKDIATLTAYFTGLKSVEATGDYTVKFTFSDEKIGGLEKLLDSVYVITEAGWEQSGDEMTLNPIGTSPYVLDEYVSGQKMVFKKADSYWQTDELTISFIKPNVDSFTWLVINDKSQQAIALESGTIDASNSITSADEVNFIGADGNPLPGYGVIESYKSDLSSIHFNCSDDSACKDENLRKAICYAIDSAAVIKSYYGKAGIQCTNFASEAYKDYNPAVERDEYYNYDVDKAKEYLGKSDYKSEELTLLCNSDTENTTMATLVQAYCDAIGVKVVIEYYDKNLTNSYLSDMTYHFDMYLGTSYGGDYSYEVLSVLTDYYYENGTSVNRISDPELTKLYDIASAKKTSSVDTLNDFYNALYDKCYSYAIGYFIQNVIYNADKISSLGVTADKFNIQPNNSVLK